MWWGLGTAVSSLAPSTASRSGGLIEFELAIQTGRCNGRGSGRQTEAVEEGLNGRRLGEGKLCLLNTSGQELGPGNAMNAAPSGVVVLAAFGLRQWTRTG